MLAYNHDLREFRILGKGNVGSELQEKNDDLKKLNAMAFLDDFEKIKDGCETNKPKNVDTTMISAPYDDSFMHD